MAKDKEKNANFTKSCNNSKIADGQSLLNKVPLVLKCPSTLNIQVPKCPISVQVPECPSD